MRGAALVPKLDHGACRSPAAHNRVSWSWKCSEMDNKDNCKYSKGTIVHAGNFKPGEKTLWEGEDKRLKHHEPPAETDRHCPFPNICNARSRGHQMKPAGDSFS